jgi:cell division protein FtsL
MSHFEQDHFEQDQEDVQVQDALRNFRASLQAWSEQELRRERKPIARSRWMMAPAMAWGLASVLAVAAVSVPVSVHHERQVVAMRHAAELEKQRLAAAEAARQAAIDDEALLNHVDSDIAQSTPDAMEPLASLMRDTTNQ